MSKNMNRYSFFCKIFADLFSLTSFLNCTGHLENTITNFKAQLPTIKKWNRLLIKALYAH